jgi:hypothetical protein
MNRTILFAVALLALAAFEASAADPRYCGPAARASDGRIARSRAVLREFRAEHPCPSTGRTRGSCPGWELDHVIPLACGGCDTVINLQWLPDATKSASGALPKDRWERRIYCK